MKHILGSLCLIVCLSGCFITKPVKVAADVAGAAVKTTVDVVT